MKISINKNIKIFSWESIDSSLLDFLNIIKSNLNKIDNHNIIIDLSLFKDSQNDQFKFLSELILFTKGDLKKSFVLVQGKKNNYEFPENILVSPTLQEAFDIIDLEEIERDLGY